jgi:hypothetical protein
MLDLASTEFNLLPLQVWHNSLDGQVRRIRRYWLPGSCGGKGNQHLERVNDVKAETHLESLTQKHILVVALCILA